MAEPLACTRALFHPLLPNLAQLSITVLPPASPTTCPSVNEPVLANTFSAKLRLSGKRHRLLVNMFVLQDPGLWEEQHWRHGPSQDAEERRAEADILNRNRNRLPPGILGHVPCLSKTLRVHTHEGPLRPAWAGRIPHQYLLDIHGNVTLICIQVLEI